MLSDGATLGRDFYTAGVTIHVVLAKRGNNAKALSLQTSTRSALVKIGDEAIRSAKSKQESSGVKG